MAARRAGWMAGRPIGLPLLVPLALARAMPATTRSRMIERSNSLNTDPIASAPRFQPPPGRFSITTLWRKALPTYSAVTRAATSMRPPFHGHSPRQRHDLDAVSLRQNKVGGKLRRVWFPDEHRGRFQPEPQGAH